MFITANQAETLIKAAQASGGSPLTKGFTQPTNQLVGLMSYDLAPAAAVLYPVMTPLRNIIPRIVGGYNIQANWKAITGINTANQRPGVSEGNRGGAISQSTAEYMAAYRGFGLENFVTFEADFSMDGFEDARALAVTQLLQATMIQEEFVDLGGNTSVPLGKTPTPTLLADAGGKVPAGTAVSVVCVALAPQAYLELAGHNNGVIGQAFNPLTAKVPGLIEKTNTDGSKDTFGGGSAQRSDAAAITASGGGHVVATVAPVRGAWGYAWFAGPAGQERLCAVTSISRAEINELPTQGQLITEVANVNADNSTSHLDYDGLYTQAAKTGSNAYWKTMNPGAALTSDGAGGIEEFEEAFLEFYNKFRLSPTMIMVSSQECMNITKKVIANNGAPLLRFTMDAKSLADGKITAGMSIGGYLNKVVGTEVPIVVHPNLAPGTIFFVTEKLPYPLPGTANVFQKKLRRDYYQIEWPLQTRKYEYGVYFDGVLQHFAPFSMGVITNIANG
jgi:hypothetical protein